MKKIKKALMAKLFNSTTQSIYNWEDDKPVIQLIYKYFDEKDISEFLETQKIEKFENIEISANQNDLDEHILFHAIQKIEKIPDLSLPEKKEFWLNGFKKALEASEKYNKDDFIKQIINLKSNTIETKIWKKSTAEWIQKNFSELEIKLIMLNKDKLIRDLSDIM